MKKQVLLGLLVLGLIMCLASAPAYAQEGKYSIFAGYAYGTNSIGCGSSSGFCFSDPGLHGYTAAFTYNFNKHIGLEANFSGHNGTPTIDSEAATSSNNGYTDTLATDLYTYTFGPKVSMPVGNFSIFTHFLVGGVHVHEVAAERCIQSSGSDVTTCPTTPTFLGSARGNGFAFKTGGGVDWNHGRWDVRILEVDYIRNEVFATTIGCSSCTPYSVNAGGNNFELSTGISFHFGGGY